MLGINVTPRQAWFDTPAHLCVHGACTCAAESRPLSSQARRRTLVSVHLSSEDQSQSMEQTRGMLAANGPREYVHRTCSADRTARERMPRSSQAAGPSKIYREWKVSVPGSGTLSLRRTYPSRSVQASSRRHRRTSLSRSLQMRCIPSPSLTGLFGHSSSCDYIATPRARPGNYCFQCCGFAYRHRLGEESGCSRVPGPRAFAGDVILRLWIASPRNRLFAASRAHRPGRRIAATTVVVTVSVENCGACVLASR